MADRLAELRRQRALLQVHLAWLDREITRAGGDPNAGSFPPFGSTPSTSPFVTGSRSPLVTAAVANPTAAPAAPAAAAAALSSAPAEAPAAVPAPSAPAAAPPPPAEMAKTDPDALLSQYRREPAAVHRDVRQGCLLYFAGAFVLLALGVAGLYFAFRAS